MTKRVHPTSWLWWSAFYILAGGAGLVFLMYTTAPGPRQISDDMRLVALGSIVGAGICVISATAKWWLHR